MRRSPVLSRISGVFDLLAAAKIQLADNFYAQELAHRGPHKNEQDPARFFWQSRDWESPVHGVDPGCLRGRCYAHY
jgi:hypothetical protein